MIRTITIGNHLSVQGYFVGQSTNGKIVIQVGNRTFEGNPVSQAA